ncbi:carbohydrate ABC transporter permease [Streptomyces lydicus]|uniref:carbohydrate ABC transporter permease n=1 Tax=Streptomyces lydicus TaxID=47763 RepID=UPI0037AA9468
MSLGTGILILTSGLKAIPEVYYEAAELDGADRGTVFRRITLPLLRPSLLFVCLTQFIAGLQSFALINVMTGDGGQGAAAGAVPGCVRRGRHGRRAHRRSVSRHAADVVQGPRANSESCLSGSFRRLSTSATTIRRCIS